MADEKQGVKVSRQQLLETLQGEQMKAEMLQREISGNRAVIRDLNGAETAVKAIRDAKDKQIMVPLGAGVFMETILDKQALKQMTNTVMMKSTPEEILKELEIRKRNIEKNIQLLLEEEKKTIDKYIATQQILQMADQTYMKEFKEKRGK